MRQTLYDEPFPSSVIVDAPRPRFAALREPRTLKLLAASLLFMVAIAIAGDRHFVSPVLAEREAIASERDRLAAKNAADEATLVGYDAFLASKEETDRRFAVATAAIPTQAELASVLGAVRDLATTSRMRLVSFAPVGGTAIREADDLYRFKATAVLRGRYADLRRFFDSVATFPRLLTVDTFIAGQTQSPEGTLDATIGLTCYYKAIPEPAPSSTTPKG
jgi:Tfp pilus assembly protein PilO